MTPAITNINERSPMKILVVRVGRVGDMIMLTPALDALMDVFPNAQFYLLTSPEGRPVLKNYDTRLKGEIIYDRRKLIAFIERARVRKKIIKGQFDYIFSFQAKKSFDRLITIPNTKVRIVDAQRLGEHFAHKCLRLVKSYHPALDIESYYARLPISPLGEQQALQQLQQLNVHDATFLIGLHPSFSGLSQRFWRGQQMKKNKMWPVQYWGEIGKRLYEYGKAIHQDIQIIMDLVPEDQRLGEQIVQASQGCVKLQIPPLNMERYKATLARMNLLITPDTGPMHIAAAIGTNIVALFANKDPADCGPYCPQNQFKVLEAKTFSKNQSEIRLAAITPELVFTACQVFLPGET